MGLFDRPSALLDGAAGIAEAEVSREVNLVEQLAQAENTLEVMSESLADAQLALEDVGWLRMSSAFDSQFTREGLRRSAELCRVMTVVNPLMGRGSNLRIAYIWAQGVSIAARGDTDAGEQDVNAVVQGFLDDESNRASLTSSQAREELERAFFTDGNIFLTCFTSPLTGRVQVRSLPFDEVLDVITNPDDRDDPWYYERSWTSTSVNLGTGRTETKTSKAYYPALGYYPLMRPKSINGAEVMWASPVLHGSVNRLEGWKFGIGDGYSALAWARSYKEFLEDWARLVKALSRFAWKATAKGRNSAQVRNKLSAAPTVDVRTGASRGVGATAIVSEGASLEAIPKTGATIDSDSGRPLAAMVAAAVDVPVTMLLCDPGQTGARAVAATLDQPTELGMGMRRDRWSEMHRRILSYVIDQAIKAPQGALKGTVRRDPGSGAEVIELAAGQARTIDITFPPINQPDVPALLEAIVKADGTGKLPPLTTARLILELLGVRDIDELLEQLVDEQGNWIDPGMNAGQAAVDAFRRGDDPAGLLNGGEPNPPPTAP
jgi:hypothetical protein